MRFNETMKNIPNAISYEGGEVYEKNPAQEWMNFLFSSYLENKFYESANQQLARFIALTEQMIIAYGVEFVAKAAFFARNELGMRTVSQVVAAMLNDYQFDNKRRFYRNFCNRPDDVAEIFSIIDFTSGKRSHAAVRGFGDYLSHINAYTLGKYKMNTREYNMYDLINITHAKSSVIDAYKKGTLEISDTWETKISAAEDVNTREQEWKRLVEENKLGYLALIRNLRNILNVHSIDHHWIVQYLCPQITNEQAIRKSMVFPYQIYSAYRYMEVNNTAVVAALEDAFRIALDNMPTLDGSTAIILDVSGSMESAISRNSCITIKEAGAVYAACILLKSENSDFIKFGSTARSFEFNKNANVFDTITRMAANDGCGYSTEVESAYRHLTKSYDRIMLISDMQVMTDRWANGKTPYQRYCKNYGRTPIYSFDLGNYHTQTDNPSNPDVHLCTSLSEETLKFISLLENGEDLVEYIDKNFSY